MEAAQSADRTTKGKTFSSQLARLKEIVAQLEQEDLELEKGGLCLRALLPSETQRRPQRP